MKLQRLIFAFLYAAMCLMNIAILPDQEGTHLLVSIGFMLLFAAGSAMQMHLYINKEEQ